MGSYENWIDEAEQRVLFEGEGKSSGDVFLEYGETNREVNEDLALVGIALEDGKAYMEGKHPDVDWSWISEHVERVQKYYMTLGKQVNPRERLMKVLISDEQNKRKLPLI